MFRKLEPRLRVRARGSPPCSPPWIAGCAFSVRTRSLSGPSHISGFEQALRERVVDFLENLASGNERIGERLAHADRLATLSRKDECTHHGGARQIKGAGPSQAPSRFPEPRRKIGPNEGLSMKIFLRIVLIVVVLVAVAAAAIYFTGNTITVMAMVGKPHHGWDMAYKAPAPDYADAKTWAALPSKPGLTALVPEGVPLGRDAVPGRRLLYPSHRLPERRRLELGDGPQFRDRREHEMDAGQPGERLQRLLPDLCAALSRSLDLSLCWSAAGHRAEIRRSRLWRCRSRLHLFPRALLERPALHHRDP